MKLFQLFEEKTVIKGYVRVSVNGRLHWAGPNLVTNGGLAYSATLLGGFAPQASPTQYETADTILIGNGGADTAGSFPAGLQATPTVPVPPVRADIQLVAQIANTVFLNAAAVPAANTVIFGANFQADLLTNGDFPAYDGTSTPPGTLGAAALFVNELGLLVSAPVSALPVLVARVAVPSIAFAPSSGTTIAVEWTVGYL